MNVVSRSFLFLGFLLAVCLVPSRASAQQTITCESNNGSRKYCGNNNPGQVSLQRQLSQSPCVQGQSWGVDNQGLWVDRGCRAEFSVGGWNGGNGGSQITCESNNGQRNYCGPGNPGQVSLVRQMSQSSCTQGQTWGVDGRGLWVDRGCRAVFSMNGGNNGGWNGGNNGNGQITCESNNGQRQYCGNVGNNVSMQRQMSQSPCIQGQTWGVDNQGLWVDRGCRAVFYSNGNGNWNGGNHGNWNGGNVPGISNYPRISADTSGRGNFNSQNLGSANITRGWVDTKNQPSVSLSGSGNFKITFYGTVTQADSRHMTIQINNSTRGQTFGTADIYLNKDKNEIESISLSGNDFNGSFSRK